VGDREKLLAGARRCLEEKGYARTTTRDIVAASSANLASIGYHFGSKEALLTAAMLEGLTDWSDMIAQVAPPGDDSASPMERLEATWAAVIESFGTHRSLWLAAIEAFAQAERVPGLRASLAESYETARVGLASVLVDALEGAGPEDDPLARSLGSFQLALLGGLTLQWLIDPERAPSAAELATAVRAVAAMSGTTGRTLA
jgi:AcrR family transcriptional regulator